MFDNGAENFPDEFIATITCGRGGVDEDPPVLAPAVFDPPRRSGFSRLPFLLQGVYVHLGTRTFYLVLFPSGELLWIVFLSRTILLLKVFSISSIVYRLWPILGLREPGLEQLMARRLYAIEFRRLARLSSGRLALVPKASRAGDVVALCRGGDVPLTLRRGSDSFRMLGECYIHEAMDGSQFHENDCKVIHLVQILPRGIAGIERRIYSYIIAKLHYLKNSS
jgi:hypothetical protein